MLCGVAPFRAPTPAAILIKHLKEIATPPRKLRGDIPVAVDRVVTQAMEKKPEFRQNSAQEIAAALRSAQAKLPLESSQPTIAAIQASDLTDIETERGLRATKKSWLRNFVPWRSGGGGEPRTADAANQSPDNTAAARLSDPASTLSAETTMAETMFAPRETDAGAPKGIRWKLATGVIGLVILLGLGLLAIYPDGREKSTEVRSVELDASGAPGGGEKILSIAIGGSKEELSVGERAKFILTVERENGERNEITDQARWSSSNPRVLETAGRGEFVARDPGTVDVLAEYEGIAAPPVRLVIRPTSQEVAAKKVEVVSLAIQPAEAAIQIDQRLPLRITGKYSDGTEQQLTGARWHSSDRAVVTVNASGELAGRRTGTAQVSASYRGLKSDPVLVSVRPPQTTATPVARRRSGGPETNEETKLPGSTKSAETQTYTKESTAPDQSKTVNSDPRQGYAELREPPTKKSPSPEASIKDHIRSARQYRDRGDYGAAFVELEKARRIDGTNQEIQAEIAVTTRACNAERSLVRPDLKCGG
jgi:hypothetical protein